MKKDFLCIDYSWVPNSRFIFNKLSELYSVDIVDETNLISFDYADDYANIILYLHEGHTIPVTNNLIARYPNAKLIQHDDTDFEDIQVWTNRKPDLIMQRELTLNSKNYWGSPTAPHHFPIHSMWEDVEDKPYDVFFMGTLSNPRRKPFVEKLIQLMEGPLSHLNWKVNLTPEGVRTPEEYRHTINRTKIGLHHYGNSYDAWRMWELASCGICTLMTEVPLLSISEDHMPFKSPVIFKDDFSDLEEKILYYLEDDRWKKRGLQAKEEYDNFHTPDHCFEQYHNNLKKYIL